MLWQDWHRRGKAARFGKPTYKLKTQDFSWRCGSKNSKHRLCGGFREPDKRDAFFCRYCCMLFQFQFESISDMPLHINLHAAMLFFYRLHAALYTWMCLGASCVVKGCQEPACPYLLGSMCPSMFSEHPVYPLK